MHPDAGVVEETAPAPPVQPPPIPITAAELANGISFNNTVALRVGLMAAAVSMLFSNLAGLLPGALRLPGFVAMVAAGGFFAVFLYIRRTGIAVNVLGGARLGWITGSFFFVINLFLAALTYLLADPDELKKFGQELRSQGVDATELQRILERPDMAAALLILGLVVFFATTSMMASVGGALGAKYFENRPQS